jgi:hypothetical protein
LAGQLGERPTVLADGFWLRTAVDEPALTAAPDEIAVRHDLEMMRSGARVSPYFSAICAQNISRRQEQRKRSQTA